MSAEQSKPNELPAWKPFYVNGKLHQARFTVRCECLSLCLAHLQLHTQGMPLVLILHEWERDTLKYFPGDSKSVKIQLWETLIILSFHPSALLMQTTEGKSVCDLLLIGNKEIMAALLSLPFLLSQAWCHHPLNSQEDSISAPLRHEQPSVFRMWSLKLTLTWN